MRQCPDCEFHSASDQAMTEHLRQHNPSPAQWTAAYNKIQAGKEKAKRTAKTEDGKP